uniref:Chitin-binding type-2 domain-containing protein n=1 Tax=Panagrellus redivivus TaxID=6233 RepID=A0A7E4V277_PANRE
MKPKYGFVKRATNRAPCPSDFSWKKHQEICGGKYTKVSPVPPYAPLDQPKPTNDENVPLQIPESVSKKAESVNIPVPEPKKKRASPVPTAIIKGGVTKKKASPEKK